MVFLKTRSITLKNYFARFLPQIKKENCVLFHFSSLGEMNAARGLIEYFKSMNINVFITVFTETAYLYAKEKYPNVFLMPVDFYFTINLFVKNLKPSLAFITETEIWPSYIKALSKHSKVIWINARMSEKSYKRYLLLRPLLRYVLKDVDIVFAQSREDFERFSTFVDQRKIMIAGNTKYDIDNIDFQIPADILKIIERWKKDIFSVILGSIHPDEFEYFAKAYKMLKDERIDIKILVVPRHIERLFEFEKIFDKYSIDFIRFSDIKNDPNIKCESFDFMIFDITGYLSKIYAIFDLAFVGGTLNKIGGHNLLEPSFHSKPVIFGPSYHNQKKAGEKLIEKGGGFKVLDEYDIKSRIKYLIYNNEMLKKSGESSKKAFEELKGAKEIIIKTLEKRLGYLLTANR